MGGVRAAVVAQFYYCGAQVGTWSAFIPYQKQYTHVSERGAGLLLTSSLIALTCGRFLSTVLMRWVAPARMMAIYAVVNVVLVLVAVVYPGAVGAGALVATSFYVNHVSDHLCVGSQGVGQTDEDGWLAHRDGGRGWCDCASATGAGGESDGELCYGLCRGSCLLWNCCGLRFSSEGQYGCAWCSGSLVAVDRRHDEGMGRRPIYAIVPGHCTMGVG
jgi:hypothetical protein